MESTAGRARALIAAAFELALLAALLIAAFTAQDLSTVAVIAVIATMVSLLWTVVRVERVAAVVPWLISSAAAAYLVHVALDAGTTVELAESLAACTVVLSAIVCLLWIVMPELPSVLTYAVPPVLAALVALAATWYSGDLTDRFLDATTTNAAVAQPSSAGPAKPGKVLWAVPTTGDDNQADAAAGEVLAWHGFDQWSGQPTGLIAYDARTGKERWRYLRRDLPLRRVGIAGGTAILAGRDQIIGLDLVHGTVSWRRAGRGDHSYIAGGVLLLNGIQRGEPTVAYDADTGVKLWRHSPAPGNCVMMSAVAQAKNTVLAWDCASAENRVRVLVEAVSAAGASVWTTTEPGSSTQQPGDLPPTDNWLVAVGDVVVHSAFYDVRSKNTTNSVMVAYDGATGSVRWQNREESARAVSTGSELIDGNLERLSIRDPKTGVVAHRQAAASGGWSLSHGAGQLYVTGAGGRRGLRLTVLDDKTLAVRGSADIPITGCPSGHTCSSAVLRTTPTAGVLLVAPRDPSALRPVVVGDGGDFTAR